MANATPGVVTTTVAYLFLTFSNFEGLQQLGVFTIAGLLMAAAMTRWFLPLLVPRGFKVSTSTGSVHALLVGLGKRAPSWRLAATIVVAASGVFLLATDRPLRDFQVDALSPIPLERRVAAREVRKDLACGLVEKLLVVVAPRCADSIAAQRRPERNSRRRRYSRRDPRFRYGGAVFAKPATSKRAR